jgi:hypothetical protein
MGTAIRADAFGRRQHGKKISGHFQEECYGENLGSDPGRLTVVYRVQ